MDDTSWVKGWAVLVSVWPKEAPPVATIQVYRSTLDHLEPSTWEAAVLSCVSSCKFFPKPAELLEAAASLALPDKRTGIDAWGDVQKAIADHGFYHPPGDGGDERHRWQFDDALVGRIVASLGWGYLCHSEDGMADRAHFIKAYEQGRDREHEQARQLPAVTAERARLADGRREQALQLMGAIGRRNGE